MTEQIKLQVGDRVKVLKNYVNAAAVHAGDILTITSVDDLNNEGHRRFGCAHVWRFNTSHFNTGELEWLPPEGALPLSSPGVKIKPGMKVRCINAPDSRLIKNELILGEIYTIEGGSRFPNQVYLREITYPYGSPKPFWIKRFIVVDAKAEEMPNMKDEEVKLTVTPELASALVESAKVYAWQQSSSLGYMQDFLKYAIEHKKVLEKLAKTRKCINPKDWKVDGLPHGYDTVAHYLALNYPSSFDDGQKIGGRLAEIYKGPVLHVTPSESEKAAGAGKVRIYPVSFLNTFVSELVRPF